MRSALAGLVGLSLIATASAGAAPTESTPAETAPAEAAELEATAAADAVAEPVATAPIDAMYDGFIDVMKRAEELGFEGRVAELTPLVDAAYDLDFMALKSLGSGGKSITEDERARWIEAFGGFIVSNYARRFQTYTGQRFETLGEEEAPRGQVVIRTQVVRVDEEPVRLDYRMRETSDGWRIIDIYARGTSSLLAVRRAEFSSFLAEQGIDELVASVNARAAEQPQD